LPINEWNAPKFRAHFQMTSSPRASPSPYGSPSLARRARTPLDALGLDITGVSPRPGTPKSATPPPTKPSPAASWTAQVEALMSGNSSRPGTPTSQERATSRALGKIRDVCCSIVVRNNNHLHSTTTLIPSALDLDDLNARHDIIHSDAAPNHETACEFRASHRFGTAHRRRL